MTTVACHLFRGKAMFRTRVLKSKGDKERKEIKKNGKAFSLSTPGAYRGSARRFQRQADGSEPGRLTREGRRYEREDRRRWSKRGREYERGVASWRGH